MAPLRWGLSFARLPSYSGDAAKPQEGNTVVMIAFDKREEGIEERLARFVSELIRQGVRFSMRGDNVSYEVTLTGGY